MTLALQALNLLPAVPGVALTCHVATWFWAAQEAQALGLSTAKAPMTTIMNIAGMAVAPQAAILALPRAGNWNFAITPATPPTGSVLLWTLGATHSAVVGGNNLITGYNQVAQFPALHGQIGRTSATPAQLAANQRICVVISEGTTIVARAGVLDL